jgi:predicted nuclease with TOPRIM domain
LAKVASKVAQVSDLEAILAHTQDDREASEALVNIFAEKLKAAAAEKKELKKELAALENTVCDLEDRLDTALDDADDDDGDFADRLSSEEARAGEELVGAACGRRYTFEQREHTIKLLGKQVMPSQIPGILVRFKVFDIHVVHPKPRCFFCLHMGTIFLP